MLTEDGRFAAPPLLGSNKFFILNPLGENAKSPGWGLSYFGGGASPLRTMLCGQAGEVPAEAQLTP